MTKLTILGATGVLVEDPGLNDGGWVPLPGSLEAVARLNQAGVRVVLAFNEPALAHGRLSARDLNERHRKLGVGLARFGAHLDGLFFCPHSVDANCDCRIPGPGLYREILRRFALERADVLFLSASEEDCAGARALSAPLLRIDPTADERYRAESTTGVCQNLARAVDCILAQADE